MGGGGAVVLHAWEVSSIGDGHAAVHLGEDLQSIHDMLPMHDTAVSMTSKT